MDKYFYPIPKEKFDLRFKPVLSCLAQNKNATLLALPFTGRTSHLRFIASQKMVLRSFGIDTSNVDVCFVDPDVTDGSYEAYLLELLNTLGGTNVSKDSYLISKEIVNKIKTKNNKVLIFVTLNNKCLNFIENLDYFIASLCKTFDKQINILWSIDTTVWKTYKHSHPSSSLYENLFYFKTFDKSETVHSLTRLSMLKDKMVDKRDLLKLTGGIAGIFHSYLNGSNNYRHILELLKSELNNLKETKEKLLSKDAESFIYYNLRREPNTNLTANELLVFDLFKKRSGNVITRDQVAEKIWGETWQNKYSDWAIDKMISRLRKKIPENYQLLSQRNNGYLLRNIYA